MGATLFAGCLVTSLGPATVVFLLAVAPHANLVVLATLRCVEGGCVEGAAASAERARRGAVLQANRSLYARPTGAPPPAAAVTRSCAVQRLLLGVFDVCGVAGVAGNSSAASEFICLSPPRRGITGPLRWWARAWLLDDVHGSSCLNALCWQLADHAAVQELFRYAYYVLCKAAERRLGIQLSAA